MVNEISELIFTKNWYCGQDQGFYELLPEHHFPFPNTLGGNPRELIRRLRVRIIDHIQARDDREPHYEDYFSCLRQIVDDEESEIINPLLEDFVSAFRNECADLWGAFPSHINHETARGCVQNRFASLVDKASQLIEWVVRHSLAEVKEPLGFDLLLEAAPRFASIDIFSLNHDTLVENCLRTEGIAVTDGFGGVDGDARFFNGHWDESSVRLFKLHGSINWHLLQLRSRGARVYGRLVNRDQPKDSLGVSIGIIEELPRFLTGTIGKEQAYGTGIFGDIFHQFRQSLGNHRTLICSGYGWTDKGINIRVNDWLLKDRRNRVVILHDEEKEDEPLKEKRFWYHRWEQYARAEKLFVVPRWFCDCRLADIETFCG
jgi:hypothetical protein